MLDCDRNTAGLAWGCPSVAASHVSATMLLPGRVSVSPPRQGVVCRAGQAELLDNLDDERCRPWPLPYAGARPGHGKYPLASDHNPQTLP